MIKLLFVTMALSAAMLSAPVATADPIPAYCHDARLCGDDFGSTFFCPDTGRWVGPFAACDALVTGGYRPGGQRPNESSWDVDDG